MAARTIVVTGATGALGSEMVRALGVAKYSVVALFHRNEAGARQLRAETGCHIRQADVADESSVEAAFRDVTGLYGVVHVAAIARDALLLRQNIESWRESRRVNVDGAFLVTRMALRALPDGGRLILFGSRAGQHGAAGQAAYAAAKAANEALMKSAAREGGARRLAVNLLCPGFVPSALSSSLDAEQLESFRRESVLSTFGTAPGVAAAVLWLLSEAAGEVSGQAIACHSRV